jgi:hypothetical protein
MSIKSRLRARLRTLARATREESDLQRAFRAFDGGVAPWDDLIARSEPARNEVLETSIVALARKLRGESARVSFLAPPMLVPDERFWHGSALIDACPAMFFYFEEHDVGMAALSSGGLETSYVRFTMLRTQPLALVRGGHA